MGQKSIPTLPGANFQSTIQALRENPVPFVANLAHTYGDLVRLPFGDRDLYLVNHPDYIRELFLAGSDTFAKRKDEATEQSYISGISPLFSSFTSDLIPTYAPLVVEAALKTDARWQTLYDQQGAFTVDIYREMMATTIPIVYRLLFHEELEEDSATIAEALLTMDVGYGFDTVAAIFNDIAPPPEVSIPSESAEARAYLLGMMQKLVNSHNGGNQESEFFLSQILQLELSKERIADIALRTFCAMHEVTVTALSWVWYLLSETPDVEAQLHSELDSVLGGRTPTFADIQELSYLQMVLQETRRLYTAVWLIGRFVRREVSLGGHVIPKNSIVLASQQIMHRDPRYFPNPDQFDPSRWTPECVATRPEFSFFPFSAGPRQCLGRDFAWLEDSLILATLAQNWQAQIIGDQVLEPYPQKSFMPRYGIKMTLDTR
ncbi:MAG: cytochrome P450 [Crocosphaera sp.]|nr:cytochrome P450 [Crocosphaera sp.]